MAAIDKTDKFLQKNFGVELLSEDEIDYEGVQSDMWNLSEGPNAKNTVRLSWRFFIQIIFLKLSFTVIAS